MAWLADHAKATPDKPAMIIAETGETLTYKQLDDRSNQLAQLLYARGLRHGDHIAVFVVRDWRRNGEYWKPGEIAEARMFARDQLPAQTERGTRARIDEIFDAIPKTSLW